MGSRSSFGSAYARYRNLPSLTSTFDQTHPGDFKGFDRDYPSAAETIEFPEDESVEVASDETLDRSVELGSLDVLVARDPLIGELVDDFEAQRLRMVSAVLLLAFSRRRLLVC